MAAHGVSFQSVSSIDEEKERKRQARKEAIEKAKQQFEREERRKELKRQRGEDTWMLPEVDQRLQQLADDGSLKSKKKKEKKSKKKKEKKKKAKKEKKGAPEDDGSSGSSADSEAEWVEAKPEPQPAKPWQVSDETKPAETDPSQDQTSQRDEWMTFDFLAMKTTSTADRRAEKERKKEEERAKAQAIEQAGLHKLELNPYWKDGGSGLPPEQQAGTAVKKASTVVNDGGLSWLRKSYQRMKEQAEREQRSLNDIVAERYGSMETFQQRMAEAEEALHGQKRGRDERDGWRKGREDTRERWRRREEDGDRRNDRHHSPSDRDRCSGRREETLSFRDKDGRRDREEMNRERDSNRGRERDGDSEKDRGGSRERYREHYRGSDRDGYRDQDNQRSHMSSSSSSTGKYGDQRPLSLGSLKGRFLKPSEDEDSNSGPSRHPSSAQRSAAFKKPSSDDDEDTAASVANTSAWKKSANPANKPESHDNENSVTKTTLAAPDDGPGDQAAVEASSESSSEEEELPLLSEEEMNKLGAKLVKAEIMGNTAMVAKLKAQLDAAHKAKESHTARMKLHEAKKLNQAPGRSKEEQELVLFRTDHSGRAWPVNAPSGHQEPHRGRRKKTKIETHVDGERVRYFQDDDSMGLQEMVRREKMSTAQDQNALYSRMAAKMMGKTDGDNYTLDDMFVSSAAQKEGEGRDEERMRNRAIGESRKLAASMDKCRHCFSSPELPKHLIIAVGSKVYLSLPAGLSMTEGHCLICPLQHHCSATGLDEDIWDELQVFRRSLVRMFESQELDCVFLETNMSQHRRQHMVVECIPLPRELGDMAPIYFKKAIMECDEEWAMNKKVVDLSSRDIRKAVPRGLPYFAVDFGLQGGFAHVIENEQKFPHYFGKEVVGGMMDLEPRRWRKLIRENFDDQRKKVLQFAQWWKPYDCTKAES
ncbi:CWF19-like protein 2 [Neosynchiropus ocellatus]